MQEVLSVQFGQLHWAFTTNMSELTALYSYPLFGLYIARVFLSAQSCVWTDQRWCVCWRVISSVCRVTVTDNIRILVRDAGIPASDNEQSARICTRVFNLLRSRRCILKANNAGLWVLRSACGWRSAALWQWHWGGGGERGADGSSSWPRCGGGVASTWQERLCVGSDLVVLIVFLVVHAGPGRLVLHAL